MIRPCLTLILTALFIGLATATPKMPLSTNYWKSSAFLKDFNGSYRINASIEPVLSSSERGELVAIQALMVKGQRTSVISKLKASALLSTSAAIQFNLANVLSENGDLQEAISYYQKAISKMPAFRRAHQNLAYVYVKNGDLTAAYPHLVEVLKQGGNDGSVHGLLAHYFQQEQRYEPALVSFKNALLVQPESRDWQVGVARCLHQLGRTEEALRQYQTLLKNKEIDNSSIELQLSYLYMEIGENQKAVTWLELLRRKGKLDDEQELLLGTLLLNTGNSIVAADTLLRVLAKPEFKANGAALNAVRYCVDLFATDLAESLHGKIVQEELEGPEQKVAYQRLKARILMAKDATSEGAVRILESLIADNPTDSHSLILLGQNCLKASEPLKALLLFEQAINAQGSHSVAALLEKAQVQVKLGEYEGAVSTLKLYLKANEQSSVREYLEAIEALQEAQTGL